MLTSRIGSFEGLRAADLFAGTGALGLEALSRGAGSCLFVEKDRAAIETLRRNIARLGAQDRSEVRTQAIEHVPPPARPLDLVLLDPPYGSGLARIALDRIATPGWLAPGAWVSLELSAEEVAIPEGLAPEAERKFGKARILLMRAEG